MKEFSQRAQKVNERAEEEANETKNSEDRIRRDVIINDKIYVSGTITEEELKAHPDIVKLTMKQYDPKVGKTMNFFSNFPPEEILGDLAALLDKKHMKYRISAKSKLRYDTAKVLQSFELENDAGI